MGFRRETVKGTAQFEAEKSRTLPAEERQLVAQQERPVDIISFAERLARSQIAHTALQSFIASNAHNQVVQPQPNH